MFTYTIIIYIIYVIYSSVHRQAESWKMGFLLGTNSDKKGMRWKRFGELKGGNFFLVWYSSWYLISHAICT